MTSANGTVISRHDYQPFGEEIGAGVGGRTTAQGYSQSNGMRQKFACSERDGETGLDYMKARYYSSSQGRFTGVDPVFITPKRLFDPQRLNLYAYTRNNPLKFIDPDGIDLQLITKNEEEAKRRFAQWQLGIKKEDRKHTSLIVGDGKNGFAKGEFGIGVDKNHKSDSENFQMWQKVANDKARTELHVVGPNEDIDANQ